MKLPAKDINTI